MKQIFTIITFLLLSLGLFAQENTNNTRKTQVKSRNRINIPEKKQYEKNLSETYSNLKEPTEEDILNFAPKYCKLSDKVDFYDYLLEKNNVISKIYSDYIIKYEQAGELIVFIYIDNDKYTDVVWGDPSIWIAISKDGGNSWAFHFTGLYYRQPILFDSREVAPMIIDENTFRLNARLMLEEGERSHPMSYNYYSEVKNIVVTFDMREITKDSDGDGLTDILEELFRTDPNNHDTNGNGIPDNVDPNPRQKAKRGKETSIYEAIINDRVDKTIPYIDDCPDSWLEIKNDESRVFTTLDFDKTILIITENPEVLAIQPKNTRVIIITPNEYKKNISKILRNELEIVHLSPLFLLDDDTYLVNISYVTSSVDYIVQRTKDGWRIQMYSHLIY